LWPAWLFLLLENGATVFHDQRDDLTDGALARGPNFGLTARRRLNPDNAVVVEVDVPALTFSS